MGGAGGWWRGKTTPAKVETYTRWSFHFFALIEVTTIGLPAFGKAGPAPWGWLTALVVAHAALCALTASRALDWTRGLRERPVRLLWLLGAASYAVAVTALVLREHGGPDQVHGAAASVFVGVLAFGAGTLALGARDRRRVAAVVAGFACGAGAVSVPLGMPGLAAPVMGCVVLVSGGFLAAASIFSVWLLNAVYELDEARETRARLAVAEERLRFGRDLHDVLGRNLAVIALKSELAVQLARRERPEAVEQMVEVQRIAQESQREVRAVVRGYRDADLGAELTGAQGVLSAAGISCEVTGDTTGLPAEVQSALGWVVREATTNVLRHGDAGRCAVGVRIREGAVVLTVENDGAAPARAGGGGNAAGSKSGVAGAGGSPDRTGAAGTVVREAGLPAGPGVGSAVPVGTATGPGASAAEAAGGLVSGSGGGAADGVGTVGGSRGGGGGGAGSGLVGLRERLAGVGGTLEAGPVGADGFRVVASVPLSGRTADPSVSGVTS
ncbi:histidine kinase [Streptomyces sp. NPDC006654]|uniref:sensor histidine kinase n=1 Tax=Streptomyces sp. NPDC006654 TaxID=3156897 RepID=UPI0033D19E6E